MDTQTAIVAIVGGLTGLAFLGLLYGAYRSGKSAKKAEQNETDIEALKQQQALNAKPKSSSADDRDSMLNGDF